MADKYAIEQLKNRESWIFFELSTTDIYSGEMGQDRG